MKITPGKPGVYEYHHGSLGFMKISVGMPGVITRLRLQDMLVLVVLVIVLLICVWRLLRVPFLKERVAFICRYCAWRLEFNWCLPNLADLIVPECDSGSDSSRDGDYER